MFCNVFFVGFLHVFTSVDASVQCNMFNLYRFGIFPCYSSWWQTNSFEEQTSDLELQFFEIITKALEFFGLPPDIYNPLLNYELAVRLDNPLAKLVETYSLIEPYAVYMVMDLIEGFDLTVEELTKLGFPTSWTSSQERMKFYQNYLNKACEL